MNFSFSIAPWNNRSTALRSWLVGATEKADLRVANCRQQCQPENKQDASYPQGHHCRAQTLSFGLILTQSEAAGFQGGHVQQQRRHDRLKSQQEAAEDGRWWRQNRKGVGNDKDILKELRSRSDTTGTLYMALNQIPTALTRPCEVYALSFGLAPEKATRVQEEEHRQKVVQDACKGSVLAAEGRNTDSQLNHEPLLFGEAGTRNSPVRRWSPGSQVS